MKLAEVVTLYENNASNIAAMMRDAADSIEGETDDDNRTEAVIAVQIAENGAIKVYGWGATDSMKAIATLELGKADMIRNHLEEFYS
jgi:hypothetical protein